MYQSPKSKMLNDLSHVRVTTSHQRGTLRILLVFLLVTINDAINLESATQRHTGVYVENGDDQPATHRLTTDKKLAPEHQILKPVGLPDKPKSTNSEALLMEQSAFKFLLNVQKNITKKPNQSVEPSEFDFTENDLRMISQSDIITPFIARQSHQGAEGQPDRVKIIWFDVGSVPAEDQVISAQLKLYWGSDPKNHKNRGAFAVTVHRLVHTKDGQTEMELVDSANTTAGHEGWITLNLTKSLLHWMRHPGDNKGLYLSAHPIDISSNETRPNDIGVVRFEGDAGHQPFMAGFFRKKKSDRVRLIPPPPPRIEKYTTRARKYQLFNQRSGEGCKVERFHMSFEELGEKDIITGTEGFDLNYCSGECSLPLNIEMSMTNHALYQSKMNRLYPEKMPKPCCTPTKLSAISAFYLDDNRKPYLKIFHNMSVEACGCQ